MCYGLDSSFTYFLYFEARQYNKCFVIKLTAILFDYNIV